MIPTRTMKGAARSSVRTAAGDARRIEAGEDVARYADMFSAIGTEPRLRIMRLLLRTHPDGMVAGHIQAELGMPASTLSHHLDKLRHDDLVTVTREGTYLRYAANTETLRDLLGFLYAECCTRNRAVRPQAVRWIGKRPRTHP